MLKSCADYERFCGHGFAPYDGSLYLYTGCMSFHDPFWGWDSHGSDTSVPTLGNIASGFSDQSFLSAHAMTQSTSIAIITPFVSTVA